MSCGYPRVWCVVSGRDLFFSTVEVPDSWYGVSYNTTQISKGMVVYQEEICFFPKVEGTCATSHSLFRISTVLLSFTRNEPYPALFMQIPASTVGDTAPGLAHWPTTDGVRLEGLDGILETVSLPQIRALVRSARLQTTVRGQRVFRRNGGAVCRLGREVCGPEGLLWSKAAWDGARKAALSGLEGLVGVPESALLEGFRQVVVSTAGAHLEGLKQQGREGGVRGRLQACGAKILRPNHGGRRTGGDCNKQLGARSGKLAASQQLRPSFDQSS